MSCSAYCPVCTTLYVPSALSTAVLPTTVLSAPYCVVYAVRSAPDSPYSPVPTTHDMLHACGPAAVGHARLHRSLGCTRTAGTLGSLRVRRSQQILLTIRSIHLPEYSMSCSVYSETSQGSEYLNYPSHQISSIPRCPECRLPRILSTLSIRSTRHPRYSVAYSVYSVKYGVPPVPTHPRNTGHYRLLRVPTAEKLGIEYPDYRNSNNLVLVPSGARAPRGLSNKRSEFCV